MLYLSFVKLLYHSLLNLCLQLATVEELLYLGVVAAVAVGLHVEQLGAAVGLVDDDVLAWTTMCTCESASSQPWDELMNWPCFAVDVGE